jgi:hypothetical protein
MNVVLYTTDLEPITILDLPVWLLEQLEKQEAIRVAVLRPPTWTDEKTPVKDSGVDTVTIYCEKLRWRDNRTKIILVTPDEELALTLRPDWLPGQLGTIQSYKSYIRHLTEQLVKAMRKN